MRPEKQPKAFVPDRHGKPPDPCARKRARKLPAKGGARLRKRFPFTIRLADRLAEDSVVRPLTLKPDPGGRGTGAALVLPLDEGGDGGEPAVKVIALFEFRRRGAAVSKGMRQRSNYRRRRRARFLPGASSGGFLAQEL
ncbi:MAG: RRXRR domain-containing protein [Deltaproteobacteria bacterium]|nr:RRXRR domain-containing protein [Deltaproteobacteria bacterium]